MRWIRVSAGKNYQEIMAAQQYRTIRIMVPASVVFEIEPIAISK